eukprot:7719617-Pyramimonas_sp.AAC.2
MKDTSSEIVGACQITSPRLVWVRLCGTAAPAEEVDCQADLNTQIKLLVALDYKHKAFVVSAARRAVESSQIMAETRHGAGADVSMILVASLHPHNQTPQFHKMFAQLGYASLQVTQRTFLGVFCETVNHTVKMGAVVRVSSRSSIEQKYLEQPGGEEAVNSYAYIVMEDLLDCFSRISAGTRGDTLTHVETNHLVETNVSTVVNATSWK